MEPHAAQAGRRLLGRYVLHGEIASGGMAAVHLGRLLGPVGFARTVAIKKLHPQFAKDPAFVAMFLDEARLAARIRHPNVVPTLDVVQTDDESEIFLVMEYVQGESLSRLIKNAAARDERIPPEIACAVVMQTLLGLHAAHEAKSERGTPLEIVHRDVSPHNVLVGIDGIARVLDFGIAKATSRLQTTQDGQLKGKLAYMAPEQIERADVDRRADVYAAAVVLWETLTGRRLFVETSPAHLMKLVLDGAVSRPSELVATVPEAVEEIVMKGLARDPDARFATAEEMALALDECGCMAKPRVVGELVDRLAHDALGRRAEKLAEIEAASGIHSVGASEAGRDDDSSKMPTATATTRIVEAKTTPSSTPLNADPEAGSLLATNVSSVMNDVTRVRRRTKMIAAVGAVAVIVIGVGAWAFTRGEKEPRRPPAVEGAALPVPGASTTSSPPSSVPMPQSTPATTATASATTSAPTGAMPKPSASPAPTAKPAPKKTPKKAANCSPPYTVDAQGVKIPKLECL